MGHRSHFVLAMLAGLVTGVNGAAADCPRGTVTGKVTYIRDGDTIEQVPWRSGCKAWRRPKGVSV